MKQMEEQMKSIIRIITRFIINHFLSCTRFFSLKRLLLRISGVKVGKNTKIVGPIYFGNKIDICIGDYCWIGKNFSCDGNGKIVVGNNVNIAPNCVLNTGGHIIGDPSCRAGMGINNTIIIGDGTWICTHVVIVNNTEVGSGNVIAAGAVVTKKSKNDVLLAGVPAKEKKKLGD